MAALPYDGIDPAWARRQMAVFRALSPSPPPESFPAFLFGQLLEDDLRESCRPALPENVGALHGVTIQGTCILQIVDIVNIGANFEHRTEDARGPTRTLKICFTDGHQLAFGFEFQWLSQLSVLTPRGSKVVIQNVDVRHGMLMLTAQNCQLLGAAAEEEKQAVGDSQDTSKPSGVYAAALTTAQFGSASGLVGTAFDVSITGSEGSIAVTAQATAIAAGSGSGYASLASADQPRPRATSLPPNQGVPPPNTNDGQAQRSRDPPPPVFVDVVSSEDECESDKTDPMVEHLFYSPNTPRDPPTVLRDQSGATPLAPNTRKRPYSSIGAVPASAEQQASWRQKTTKPDPTSNVIVINDQDAPAPSLGTNTSAHTSRPPLRVVDPSQPFQYFSAKQHASHLSALRAPASAQPQTVHVRAFIKSVAGFQFQTGEYQLRVLVEDCSQVRQVDVAPAFVAKLMGVPCAEFTRAMQQTPAIAHRWAARMQFALMTLEGVMTFLVDRSSSGAEVLTLANVRDVTREDASKLLARVAQRMRSGR